MREPYIMGNGQLARPVQPCLLVMADPGIPANQWSSMEDIIALNCDTQDEQNFWRFFHDLMVEEGAIIGVRQEKGPHFGNFIPSTEYLRLYDHG